MKRELIVNDFPKAPVSEAIRLLRTNITYLSNKMDAKIFMFTSAAPGDGKSWVTANLGAAFSQADQKVLIIDIDLRKGRQHKIFNRPNSEGFSTYLLQTYGKRRVVDHMEILKMIKSTDVKNLFLLSSGPIPPNPSELLDVCDLDAIFSMLKERFDIILVDVPPISIVADGLVVCREVDYTILVAAAGKTKKKMIVDVKKAIERVNGKFAGVVLNQVPQEKRKEYSKYYSHYDSEDVSKKNKSGAKK